MYIWTWSGDYACLAQSDLINLGYLLSILFLGSDMTRIAEKMIYKFCDLLSFLLNTPVVRTTFLQYSVNSISQDKVKIPTV